MSRDSIIIVSTPTEEQLNERQQVDYRDYKKRFVQWLENEGKNPGRVEGYAPSSVQQTSYKVDQFYRWLWDARAKYTKEVSPDDADEFMRDMIYSDEDYSNSQLATLQKILKRFYRWRETVFGGETWEPERTFSEPQTQPRDYLTIEERKSVREAALEYGAIPSYHSVTPAERDQWKIHLAQRFQKPKDEIGLEDWKRANGWKIPSMVWASLDAGLRPIEVARATKDWVDLENQVLRIPKEESSKNTDNWIVGLTNRTSSALKRWLEEQPNYPKYEDKDNLWLTREGNPYSSNSLSYLMDKLCEIAQIPTENRQLSWYAIRHSVGTYMTREEDLAAAQAQLRHRSAETTMQYDQTPVEDRKDALDRMG